MMGWSLRCYMPSLVEISSAAEDFLRIFTIYGRGGHLGHVTSIMFIDFHFLVPKKLTYKIWLKMAH